MARMHSRAPFAFLLKNCALMWTTGFPFGWGTGCGAGRSCGVGWGSSIPTTTAPTAPEGLGGAAAGATGTEKAGGSGGPAGPTGRTERGEYPPTGTAGGTPARARRRAGGPAGGRVGSISVMRCVVLCCVGVLRCWKARNRKGNKTSNNGNNQPILGRVLAGREKNKNQKK